MQRLASDSSILLEAVWCSFLEPSADAAELHKFVSLSCTIVMLCIMTEL